MPKEAFVYRETWGMETDEQSTVSDAGFERDIISRYKISEAGEAGVQNPRKMVENRP